MNIDEQREILSQSAKRGRLAGLEFPILSEVFAECRADALEEAVKTKPDEIVLRERLILTARILDLLVAKFEIMIAHGEADASSLAVLNEEQPKDN